LATTPIRLSSTCPLLTPGGMRFLAISDTYYLLRGNAQTAEWAAISQFPIRTGRALWLADATSVAFSVHLSNMAHEHPETGRAQAARVAAKGQFHRHGIRSTRPPATWTSATSPTRPARPAGPARPR
jgi:hypothetical protein